MHKLFWNIVKTASRGAIATLTLILNAYLLTCSADAMAQSATITSFSPAGGPAGTSVTITGTNFSPFRSLDTVRFNGVQATVGSASSTQIVATVPSGATTGKIQVNVNNQYLANSTTNFVVGPLPTISSFTPSGYVGSTVTISGANFGPTVSANTVKFGTVAAALSSATSTQIVTTVPNGAVTAPITVTVNGALSKSTTTNFAVTPPPTPTCSSAAPQSSTVAVNATTQRVYAYGVQNASSVSFPTWWLPGHQNDIQWLTGVNSGGGTWYADVPLAQYDSGNPRYGDFKTDVYLNNSANTNVLCQHTFWSWTFPSPTFTSLSATSGPIFSSITINGTNFSSTLSEDAVTFNGTPAAVLSASATAVTVAVPSGSTSGPIRIAVNGIGISAGTFDVTPSNYNGALWQDACSVTDPKILRLLSSEALMVQSPQVSKNADGTYNIQSMPFETISTFNGMQPLDPATIFYGTTQAANGRSAFLIGPQLMMTAPHGSPFSASSWVVIFGISPQLVAGSGYQTYVCQQPSFTNVPASNVYFPDTSKPVYNSWTSSSPTYDYVAFYLTQSPNRPYLRLRRDGAAEIGDPAVELGHPAELATKISPAVELLGLDSATGAPTMNGVHLLNGSSGSMIYNLSHDYIESIVSEAWVNCVSTPQESGSSYYTLQVGNCTPPSYVNRGIADVAATFPAYSLMTTPQSDIVDQIPVGGTASTTYTLTAPSTAGATINWQVLAPTGLPSGAPTMSFTPSSGSITAGSATNLTSSISNANQCGVYDETFKVYDNTNGFADSLTHHIEVGMTDFDLAPSTGLTIEKAIPPYNGVQQSYTLTNPRPTAITVQVSSATWVDLSYSQTGSSRGLSPTPLTLTLGPSGSATATATVTVSLDEAAAENLSIGTTYSTNVTFANISSCPVETSETRPVSFTPGQQNYVLLDTNWPFTNPSVTEILNVPDNFTVGNASVAVSIYASDNRNDAEQLFQFETIQLISPAGTTFTLWNKNGVPSGNYYSWDFVSAWGSNVGTLHIDDSTAPSPTGAHLSSLAGQSSQGSWTLKITTTSDDYSTFVQWALNLSR